MMNFSFTNYEMERCFKKLQVLYQSDKEMPATVAYSIVRTLNAMQDVLAPFGMVRDQLVRRYSGGKDTLSRDDNPEAYESCIKELDEIGNKMVNVELPEIELKDLTGVNFTPKEMACLQIIIKQQKE